MFSWLEKSVHVCMLIVKNGFSYRRKILYSVNIWWIRPLSCWTSRSQSRQVVRSQSKESPLFVQHWDSVGFASSQFGLSQIQQFGLCSWQRCAELLTTKNLTKFIKWTLLFFFGGKSVLSWQMKWVGISNSQRVLCKPFAGWNQFFDAKTTFCVLLSNKM